MFLHELQFIAKKKGIPNYLEMSKEELSEAIVKHKKEIKKTNEGTDISKGIAG